MSDLATAIDIAVEAHRKQRRKNGSPYILHPLRIMFRMKTDEERIVALLHDVVEDSSVTLSDLEARGFTNEIVNAVGLLTKHDHCDYEAYLTALAGNSLARRVKIGDLLDNLDISELPDISDKDLIRLKKYKNALRYLMMVEHRPAGDAIPLRGPRP